MTDAKKRYEDLMPELDKPFHERKKMAVGKHGKLVVPRRYHHKQEVVESMQQAASATGGVVNPFQNRVGAYWGAVEALIKLGPDQWHTHNATKRMMETVMSSVKNKKDRSCWETFADRPKRADNGKDLNGRIIQNFKVLQRLQDEKGLEHNPYGTKLAQFKMCVDMKFVPISEGSDMGTWHYRLNTQHEAITDVKPMFENPVARPGRKKKLTPEEMAALVLSGNTEMGEGMGVAPVEGAGAEMPVESFDDGGAGLAEIQKKEFGEAEEGV
jgi:hypothetical protein